MHGPLAPLDPLLKSLDVLLQVTSRRDPSLSCPSVRRWDCGTTDSGRCAGTCGRGWSPWWSSPSVTTTSLQYNPEDSAPCRTSTNSGSTLTASPPCLRTCSTKVRVMCICLKILQSQVFPKISSTGKTAGFNGHFGKTRDSQLFSRNSFVRILIFNLSTNTENRMD